MKSIVKRILCTVLVLSLLFSFFACTEQVTGGNETENGGEEQENKEENKKENKKENSVPEKDNIEYVFLGTPLADRYSNGERARCALDLIFYNEMLYAGSGDYDINLGPATISRYDPGYDVWDTSATVPDEEVNRFFVIDGKVMTPGIDPKEDWDLGNYYVLSDDGLTWEKVRTIPNGIHTFDMIEYGEGIFVGCGVSSGGHPVRVSWDGGETFTPVEMRKDGVFLDTTAYDFVRTYDFFLREGILYATLHLSTSSDLPPMPTRRELYRYDAENGIFVFEADLQGVYEYKRNTFVYVDAKAEFDGALYLTTGVFYDASDLTSPKRIELCEGETVSDLYLANGKLYALTYKPEGEGYRIKVYAKTSAEEAFKEQFNFYYDVPAASLAVDDTDFYLGMGYTRKSHEKNGDVLYINYWGD